ncbi:MAG: hypothetical protein QOJ10_376 [Chloroflexota bacterium]|nr:hypothetical protein [Chloroflexota bacterium]
MRLLGNHSAVDIDDSIARIPDGTNRRRQQVLARGALETRVARGEVLADVSKACSTEEGVDDGVCQDVGVGIPIKPDGMVDAHPAKNEVPSGAEWVRIVTRPDPHLVAASCSLMSASTTSKSSGVVSLILAGSPSTTVTACPVAATS